MATQSASSGSRSDADERPRSRSAGRILDLLDLFLTTGGGGLSLTEISRRLGIPKSTALGFLHTMRERGHVVWDEHTKLYSIGLRLVALAGAVPVHQAVRVPARPHLERLAAESQETAILHGYQGNAIISIDLVESPQSLRYLVRLGSTWPLYATAAGKVALARMSDDDVLALLASGMERVAAGTIVDPAELLAQLADVRRNGWAGQADEIIEGVAGYAAPVTGYGGDLVAALTVTGPTDRITARREEIVPVLVREAESLSRELAKAPPL